MECNYPLVKEIIYTPTFKKAYIKLPKAVKLLAERKERIFRKNIFSPQLGTHKLNGNLNDCWAFSINDKYRIIFELAQNNIVYFEAVGTHDIYY